MRFNRDSGTPETALFTRSWIISAFVDLQRRFGRLAQPSSVGEVLCRLVLFGESARFSEVAFLFGDAFERPLCFRRTDFRSGGDLAFGVLLRSVGGEALRRAIDFRPGDLGEKVFFGPGGVFARLGDEGNARLTLARFTGDSARGVRISRGERLFFLG